MSLGSELEYFSSSFLLSKFKPIANSSSSVPVNSFLANHKGDQRARDASDDVKRLNLVYDGFTDSKLERL